MASPFPGMDPYLESPAIWPDVHARLITIIGELLTEQVAPRYFVGVERRVYVLSGDDPAQRHFIPDVSILRSGVAATAQGPRPRGAKLAPAVLVTVPEPIEVSEPRLVVRRVGGERALVTAIELLSPTNKTAGSRGREEYLAKRRELLHSRSVHLVELDLLRGGVRVPPEPVGDYMVHVSRTELRPRGEVFVWSIRDELPEIPVPLAAGDPDASLDLARALHATYERARYELVLDYGVPPPPPPLRAEDGAWAAELARRAPRPS